MATAITTHLIPDEHGERRLHPRLRVVRNGDQFVNAVRSDAATTVTCAVSTSRQDGGMPPAPPLAAGSQADLSRLRGMARAPSGKKLSRRARIADQPKADAAYVNVIIELQPERSGTSDEQQTAAVKRLDETLERALTDTERTAVGGGIAHRRNFVAATVPVSLLSVLERDPAVSFVHAAEPLKLDAPAITPARGPVKKAIGNASTYGRGKGVLIGIVDVGGFDFAHPDFLDEHGRTRFVAIWDQHPGRRSPPKARGFDYGSEFTKAHMDGAIAASAKLGVPATLLERQSQTSPGSHGTHVASIAAGNTGVCPEASIAGVLVDVPLPDDPVEKRRTTFSDTSRIIHAVEYLLRVASEMSMPLVINVSLGTNGGAHDGSAGVSRLLDAYLAAPGRAICVAAGNAGQEKAQTEGDLGWIMGRIHSQGRVPARGLEVELEWTVVGDGIEDRSENELEIWYGSQDRFVVAVKPPDGTSWISVSPRQFLENHRLPSGTTLSIYNELYHPTNGANYIAVYLSPNLDVQDFRGIEAGVWKVRLTGEEVRDGRFNAWIERDDPAELEPIGGRRVFRFPSFFTEQSNTDSHSISSLACGHRVIAVANLDDARQRVNASSSQGPTRDGRCKPEIAAPGTNIVAANGFAHPDQPWISMTGTSMASPYVAGVVGLMLGANSGLTAAQCAGILLRTARPLPGA
jgi:subtilisin family serine protease